MKMDLPRRQLLHKKYPSNHQEWEFYILEPLYCESYFPSCMLVRVAWASSSTFVSTVALLGNVPVAQTYVSVTND